VRTEIENEKLKIENTAPGLFQFSIFNFQFFCAK